MPTDRGISLYRRRVRKQIKDLAEGIQPPQPVRFGNLSVRTYGQDTVLNLAPQDQDNDRPYLAKIGETVMDEQFAHETKSNDERDHAIIERMKEIEAQGISE